MDPLQSLLPNIDRASLNVITGGPYQVRLANGYITSIQVNLKPRSLKSCLFNQFIQEGNLRSDYSRNGNWQDLATWHHDASQVIKTI